MTSTAAAAAADMTVARKTVKKAFLMLAISMLCHSVLIPVAAWNHNLVFVVVAALAPMAIINILRKQGTFPAYKRGTQSHTKSILMLVVRTAVAAFLFWNHLWIVGIVAMVVMSFTKSKK